MLDGQRDGVVGELLLVALKRRGVARRRRTAAIPREDRGGVVQVIVAVLLIEELDFRTRRRHPATTAILLSFVVVFVHSFHPQLAVILLLVCRGRRHDRSAVHGQLELGYRLVLRVCEEEVCPLRVGDDQLFVEHAWLVVAKVLSFKICIQT
ncbi:hypothetical protein ABW21_db0209478 [Orbilia brochopaga]|nr:hypothetical protein ABW21_db0209478 [Drechslerella brochopaga]